MKTWSRGHMICWMGSTCSSHYPCLVCGPCALWKWKQNIFGLPRDHTIEVSGDFLGGISIILSHHHATFSVHTLYEGRNITFLICQVTAMSRYQWLCGRSPLVLSCHPTMFGGYRPGESGDITLFLVT